jgi:hypothetical protein
MYSRIPPKLSPPLGGPAGVPSYRRPVTPPPNYSGNAFPAVNPPDLPTGDALPIGPSGEGSGDIMPRFDDLPKVSTLPGRQGRNSGWQEAAMEEREEEGEEEERKAAAERNTLCTESDPGKEETGEGKEEGFPSDAYPADTDAPEAWPCQAPLSPGGEENAPPAVTLPADPAWNQAPPAPPSLPSHLHFPLGHGLGQEELLILGLLLFLLHEDEANGPGGNNDLAETLLLLGILLFCG